MTRAYDRPPLLLAIVALATACAEAHDDAPPSAELVPAVDVDADPAAVEYALVAEVATAEYLPGKPAEVWAYRDENADDGRAGVPGPLLRARLGDAVLVRLRNDLPVPTTIHWHGVRVPAGADGTSASQVEIPPGESYEYAFTAVDAATFWYHPHVEADVQIERGLYGALVVDHPDDPPVDVDRMLVLDDVKLEASGELSEQTNALDLMLGRQGNVLLVNGVQQPTLPARSGTRERWRFVNAANGRYFNLAVEGRTWTVIGGDGGLLPAPLEQDTLLIAPGERYDVVVDLDDAGPLAVQTLHYDRGHDIPDPGPLPLFALDVEAAPPAVPASLGPAGAVEPLVVDDATPVRSIVLSEDDSDANNPRFMIDGKVFPDHAPVEVALDGLEIWEIVNEAEMDHPFHVHGLFFQLLDARGVPDVSRGWKDTLNIPRESSVRFAIRFDNPGDWMFHCHILEHAERGMMSMLHVRP
jgi:FtsP/CotA-like multicopper oxidase with cupredoxin domain